jgi:hypothetical protein
MCLLATFRLTGILQEPLTPETITVEAVTWNMSRPKFTIPIGEQVINSYNDSVISAFLNIDIGAYYEDHPLLWGLYDGIDANSIVTINVTRGFVHSIFMKFSQIDENATLEIIEDPHAIELNNIGLKAIRDGRIAYIEAYGMNQPRYCKLGMRCVLWLFLDESRIMDHSITISLEVIYFDGTIYRKVILPIILEVLVH